MINFNKPYNRTDFLHFLEHDFLPDDFQIKESEVAINDFAVRYATSATCLGVCSSLDLEVFEINHSSNHDSRVGTAQDAFQLLLRKSYKNRALVVFVPDGSKQYRFSLLQIEALQNDQTARITRSYSNPRRYSFLLGEDAHTKTPEQFLKDRIKIKDGNYFNDLQDRFSVEVLTKQFYRELSDWYFWAVKNVSFPNDINDENDNGKYNAENVIRLITRLIFVWFLRQKELVKPDFFDTEKLSGLLKDFDAQSATQHNYYRAILQNLFFATLNQETGKRRFAEDKGFLENRSTNTIKNYYRYESDFRVSTDEVINYFSQIPFLNGGLFECLDAKIKDDRIFYWDGFSRNQKRQARVANELFFAETKVVDLSNEYNDSRMKAVKVSGIIEILKRYNFTVEENTPIDVVVALDPELLGKVFENLLGAYNPETQETARKQTGSFYTPREIVSYMVNESLIAYLKTNVPEMEEDTLRQLLSYENNWVSITENQGENLIQALFKCKILDPACGSGAFPMGILQQMVHVLGKLDPDNTYWNKVVMDDALNAFDNAGELSDDDKAQMQEEIERTFDDNVNHPNYARKLYLIENCIYGVDIQSIAVQISKLRFFISLICEQTHGDDAANNFGIRPLPNLETKFMAANTLIGIEKNEEDMELFNDDHIKKLIDRLQQLRHRQFTVTNATDKKKLRDKDKELRLEIENEVAKLYVKHIDVQLEKYKVELRTSEKKLEFLNKMPDEIRNTVSTDLFGLETTTSYNFTESLRKDLKLRIKLLIDKIAKGSDYSRLNSVVKLAKQLTSWNPYDQNTSSPFFDPEWMFGIKEGFDVVIGNPPYVVTRRGEYKGYNWEGDLYTMFFEYSINILKKEGVLSLITPRFFLFNQNNFEMRKCFINNFNIISMTECSPFDAVTENEITIIKLEDPKSNKIDFYTHRNESIIYLNTVSKEWIKANLLYEINPYLTEPVFNILQKIGDNEKLSQISKSKRGAEISKRELRNTVSGKIILLGYDVNRFKIEPTLAKIETNHQEYNRLKSMFDLTRILLLRRVSKDLISAVTDSPIAFSKNLYGIIPNSDYDIYYLCSLLNSKLLNFYYKKKFSTKKEDVFPEIQTYLYEQLPIKKANKEIQIIFSKLVIDIINLKYEDIDTTILEEQIDNLVYKLYDLTYDEVKVVDPSFALTKEEYYSIEIA